MVKSLSRHGNSLALVIEKPILELLGIDAETKFNITTDGKQLVLSPIRDDPDRRKKIDAALRDINSRYSNAMKRLAE